MAKTYKIPSGEVGEKSFTDGIPNSIEILKKSDVEKEIETFRKSFIKNLDQEDKENRDMYEQDVYCDKSDELDIVSGLFKLRVEDFKTKLLGDK